VPNLRYYLALPIKGKTHRSKSRPSTHPAGIVYQLCKFRLFTVPSGRRCMHRSLLIPIQCRSAVFEIYEQVWQPCDALFVYTNGPSFCSQVYLGTYQKLLVTCWPDVPRVAEALTNVSSTSRNSRGFGKASERPDLDKRVFRHRCGDVRLSRMLSPSQQLARSRLKVE
jgi:hypothetical protein